MTDNYKKYEPLDFAQDDRFIRWVKDPEEADKTFWEQWQTEHPEKKEVLEAARRLVLAIKVEEKPVAPAQIDRLWARIDQATQEEAPRQARVISMRRILGYVAAASVMLLFFFWILNPVEQVRSNGSQITYFFPDGSSVNLNEASKIRFNEKKWTEERTVQLSGEGFFSVKKGSKFRVITPQGEVEVLGTSFNVKSDDAGFRVSCMSGRVRVTYAESSQTLQAYQVTQLQNNGNLSAPTLTEREEIADWRNGAYTLREVSLRDILDELERQFGVVIPETADQQDKPYTFFFNNNNLDSALYKVRYITEKTIDRKGDTIIIR